MAIVLIDARYFGQILKNTRRQLKLGPTEFAKILRIKTRELHKYEKGTAPIPDHVMYRLLTNGVLTLCARRNMK